MPMTSKDMERLILADGWVFKNQVGSHRHYVHPTKTGKVTIPFHSKEHQMYDILPGPPFFRPPDPVSYPARNRR